MLGTPCFLVKIWWMNREVDICDRNKKGGIPKLNKYPSKFRHWNSIFLIKNKFYAKKIRIDIETAKSTLWVEIRQLCKLTTNIWCRFLFKFTECLILNIFLHYFPLRYLDTTKWDRKISNTKIYGAIDNLWCFKK
jgi:hypothetical protein